MNVNTLRVCSFSNGKYIAVDHISAATIFIYKIRNGKETLVKSK
jgi:hypothetical protein